MTELLAAAKHIHGEPNRDDNRMWQTMSGAKRLKRHGRLRVRKNPPAAFPRRG